VEGLGPSPCRHRRLLRCALADEVVRAINGRDRPDPAGLNQRASEFREVVEVAPAVDAAKSSDGAIAAAAVAVTVAARLVVEDRPEPVGNLVPLGERAAALVECDLLSRRQTIDRRRVRLALLGDRLKREEAGDTDASRPT
jgi:hypothetical protein